MAEYKTDEQGKQYEECIDCGKRLYYEHPQRYDEFGNIMCVACYEKLWVDRQAMKLTPAEQGETTDQSKPAQAETPAQVGINEARAQANEAEPPAPEQEPSEDDIELTGQEAIVYGIVENSPFGITETMLKQYVDGVVKAAVAEDLDNRGLISMRNDCGKRVYYIDTTPTEAQELGVSEEVLDAAMNGDVQAIQRWYEDAQRCRSADDEVKAMKTEHELALKNLQTGWDNSEKYWRDEKTRLLNELKKDADAFVE